MTSHAFGRRKTAGRSKPHIIDSVRAVIATAICVALLLFLMSNNILITGLSLGAVLVLAGARRLMERKQ